jgi:hypothetical protein
VVKCNQENNRRFDKTKPGFKTYICLGESYKMKTPLLSDERIEKFDRILSRGLCRGMGTSDGQMCIEAAITQALDLPLSDVPNCVTQEIRDFNISLNVKGWSSPHARAKHLRDLGIAQIGSLGVVNGKEFLRHLQRKIIGVLLPDLFRKVFNNKKDILLLVQACEQEPTVKNCQLLEYATYATYSAYSAYAGLLGLRAVHAANAAKNAAKNAADAANAASSANIVYNTTCFASAANPNYYFIMCADLALEVLKGLKSPGCEWL